VKDTVLVRATSGRLAEGIVTHISRTPVDMALARAQHAAYADALADGGWAIQQVPAAEDVICQEYGTRVLPRPRDHLGAAGSSWG
jgi:hypothetical protein